MITLRCANIGSFCYLCQCEAEKRNQSLLRVKLLDDLLFINPSILVGIFLNTYENWIILARLQKKKKKVKDKTACSRFA